MTRELTFRLLSIAIGLLLPLAAFEIAFRILPTKSGPFQDQTTLERPIARFVPGETFTWSMLPTFAHPRRGRVNSAGFINASEYQANSPEPLIAVVGDSFVESLQVPMEVAFYTGLSQRLAGQGRVYTFGISGAPLSQYLIWADHARQAYKPSLLVVSIVSNDFDESILAYKMKFDPGAARSFFYFDPKPGADGYDMKLVENRPSLLARLMRTSALVRYLYLNCSLRPDKSLLVRLGLLADPIAVPTGASNREIALRRLFPEAEFDPLSERAALSQKAVDWFLAELPKRAGLPPDRIILTIDGERVSMLAPELTAKTATSLFTRMRHHLITQARAAGFSVVDLDGPMRQFIKSTGRPIELTDDYHWNADGHALVADEIARTAAFRAVFPAARAASRQ